MQELSSEWKRKFLSKSVTPKSGRPLILIEAVCLERHRQLRLLLDAGVNVNCQDRDTGYTPLIQAMFIESPKQRRAIVRTLLGYGGKIVKADHDGRTAFAWACLLARNDVLRYLLKEIDNDIGLNSLDISGNDNLILACTSGNPTTVRLVAEEFRRERIDLNRSNRLNETALITAHRLGHYACVRVLVEEGYVATSLPRDILYGERRSSSHCEDETTHHSLNTSLPLIFSVYSDHLTNSFPQSKR